GSSTSRTIFDLAGIGFRISDELGNSLGRNRGVKLHDVGYAGNSRDWCDVADEVEIELAIERRVDCACVRDEGKRVASGICIHRCRGSDVAAPTWTILDDELLAQTLRQPLTHQAREDVICAAGGSRDDDAHRARRIGLRLSAGRDGSPDDGGCAKFQKSTT